MIEDKAFSFNPQLPTVTGFLGGLTFTVMILMIQFPENFSLPYFPQYAEVLIIGSAIVSFFFIMATIGGATDQRNSPLITKKFLTFVSAMFAWSLYGLVILIPAFILPFSLIGAIILGVIEGICIGIFLKHNPGMYDGDETDNVVQL